MSNIATTKNGIDLSRLDNTSKEVYTSHFSHYRIKEYSDKNLVKEQVKLILNKTFAYKGQTPSSEREYEFILKSLQEDLLLKFNDYTIEDIKLAFSYGVRGELGEYYGLNGKTFYDWLKNYKTVFLNPSIQKASKLQITHQVEVDKTIINENYIKILSDFYEKYLETQTYNLFDFGNMIYNFLDSNNVISLSKDEKLEIVCLAKHNVKHFVIEDNKHKKQLGKDFQLRNLDKVFHEIDYNLNKDLNKEVVIESKRIALKLFIDNCVSDGLSLDDFINKIKNAKND